MNTSTHNQTHAGPTQACAGSARACAESAQTQAGDWLLAIAVLLAGSLLVLSWIMSIG